MNTIIQNFNTYEAAYLNQDDYDHDFSFEYCGLDNDPNSGFPDLQGVDGNIEANPNFIPGSLYELEPDYSYFVDAGDNEFADQYDFDGEEGGDLREQGLGIDIGAQESPAP